MSTRTEEHGKTPEKGPGPCTMGRPALPCPRSGFMFCWIAGSTCVEEGKTADRNITTVAERADNTSVRRTFYSGEDATDTSPSRVGDVVRGLDKMAPEVEDLHVTRAHGRNCDVRVGQFYEMPLSPRLLVADTCTTSFSIQSMAIVAGAFTRTGRSPVRTTSLASWQACTTTEWCHAIAKFGDSGKLACN
ncbi:hypothetical protein An11g07850 [Aspergillus niger]|uniref:Uncharacterized protein n=2 Tax=Aspergillus niger TaxID=5061 RepID=A2QX71_ASPNC|nr:hypothetical protein An11g07850 [Aspergillus niger]CAK45979.1 hypothetical protein An11g07850 [Aspergillus niger]